MSKISWCNKKNVFVLIGTTNDEGDNCCQQYRKIRIKCIVCDFYCPILYKVDLKEFTLKSFTSWLNNDRDTLLILKIKKKRNRIPVTDSIISYVKFLSLIWGTRDIRVKSRKFVCDITLCLDLKKRKKFASVVS